MREAPIALRMSYAVVSTKSLPKAAVIDYVALKARLIAEREELLALVSTNTEAAKPVELDQSRVGRLSRMDAMQAQAMSIDAKRRREIQLAKIESALQRIAAGNYGECARCGEDIDEKRLTFDAAAILCIECANEAEP